MFGPALSTKLEPGTVLSPTGTAHAKTVRHHRALLLCSPPITGKKRGREREKEKGTCRWGRSNCIQPQSKRVFSAGMNIVTNF